jgi:hypothetical protein
MVIFGGNADCFITFFVLYGIKILNIHQSHCKVYGFCIIEVSKFLNLKIMAKMPVWKVLDFTMENMIFRRKKL